MCLISIYYDQYLILRALVEAAEGHEVSIIRT